MFQTNLQSIKSENILNSNSKTSYLKPQALPSRCAIYTRKSTDENLNSDFNTLDAQREAALNYITSQKHEGWTAIDTKYDDGGYTGANLERPALKNILLDIENNRIDVVVVYKIDRLSRSLKDFVKIIDFFEKHNVSLISVTQAFNTKTSMGRLTLNILLSFAQFERELTVERVKDKIAAAKRKGKYLGGRPPLGYDVNREKKCLIINSEEAEKVQFIFKRYTSLKSTLQLSKELNIKSWCTKLWINKKGKKTGAKPWNKTNVHKILKNPVYIGLVKHKEKTYKGEHKAIIENTLWDEAQSILKNNRNSNCKSKDTGKALFKKIIYCGNCKSSMGISYTIKRNRTYRYYLCTKADKNGYSTCPVKSIAAGEIEQAVISQLRSVFCSYKSIVQVLKISQKIEKNNTVISQLIKFASYKKEIKTMDKIWKNLFPCNQEQILKELIDKIIVYHNKLDVYLNINGLCKLITELTCHIEKNDEKKPETYEY